MSTKATKFKRYRADSPEVTALFDAMDPVQGEMRTVTQCLECGQLHGRRFIPYGMGRGLSVNLCLCLCTTHPNNVPQRQVAERKP